MKKESLYWDGYFIALAKVSAMRSKDPSTKVGACIIDEDKKVIGLGYNGMPGGIDEAFPWNRSDDSNKVGKTKYPYVVHAEVNAIINAFGKTKDAILYTSLYPCSNCAKTIVQAGIKAVIYENDKYHDTEDAQIARYILQSCNIETRQLELETTVDVKVGDKDFII
ncbi:MULTISPECIES: dCMP deaminase family protein [unclassified Mycoplasma]|uniref:deoxycytidylate deaminase n=1 Tax=unclassified Mycoplasma TaxID=2683645 RepID=UPI00216B32E2|nr:MULTISPECIES: dCMP deaminase family protein [unclassified Mycoplasma]MCS4537090.1 dCMP deaminase family protein [Mycoplasma sp. CSL7475-4]MCT4469778.1 dCMP deaminase family protein [Mycoplasma sp. HS2188]